MLYHLLYPLHRELSLLNVTQLADAEEQLARQLARAQVLRRQCADAQRSLGRACTGLTVILRNTPVRHLSRSQPLML